MILRPRVCLVFASCLVLMIAMLGASCEFKKGASSGADKGNPFGQESKLSSIVMNVLKTRLMAQASLSEAQANLVVARAQSKMDQAALTLGLTQQGGEDYHNDYSRFVDEMTVGAIESFVDPALGIKKRSEINKILKTVVANTFHQMEGRIKNVEDPTFYAFLIQLTDDTISSLDAGGYSPHDIDEAIHTLLETAVSNLKEAGVLTDKNAAGVISAIVQGVMHSLDSLSIGGTDGVDMSGEGFDAAKLTAGTVDDAQSAEHIEDDSATTVVYSGHIVTEANIKDYQPHDHLEEFDPATLEIDGSGADPRHIYGVTLYKMMLAIVPALKHVEFTNEQIIGVLEHVVHAYVGSMDETGFDPFMTLTVIDEGMFGAIHDLDELGLDSNEMIKAFGKMAEGAMSALKELEHMNDSHRHFLLETVVFVLASRIAHGESLSGKEIERALEEIVADATHGLKISGASDDQFVDYAVSVVVNVLHAAEDLAGKVDGFELDKHDLAIDLAGTAVGSGKGHHASLADKFKIAIEKNEDFKEFAGESFDYAAFHSGLTEHANDYVYVDEDNHFGDPVIHDHEAFAEGTHSVGVGVEEGAP